MPIFPLFSKRQRELRGEVPDMYSYNDIPKALKVQVVHIWNDMLGCQESGYDSYDRTVDAYKLIVGILCREYGVFKLVEELKSGERDYIQELRVFLIGVADAEKALDAIEVSFCYIDKLVREWYPIDGFNPAPQVDNAIAELNARFKEHGIGYQYSFGELIRIDSQLIHTEVVKPALRLLNGHGYEGPQQEYLKAYEHYRQGTRKRLSIYV